MDEQRTYSSFWHIAVKSSVASLVVSSASSRSATLLLALDCRSWRGVAWRGVAWRDGGCAVKRSRRRRRRSRVLFLPEDNRC